MCVSMCAVYFSFSVSFFANHHVFQARPFPVCVHMFMPACAFVCVCVFLRGVYESAAAIVARVTRSDPLIDPQPPQNPSAASPHPQTDLKPHTTVAFIRVSWWIKEEEKG